MKKDKTLEIIKKARRYEKLQQAKIEAIQNKEWYTCRSIFGNTWAFFYILLGGREAGKSYNVMKCFLSDWKNKDQHTDLTILK